MSIINHFIKDYLLQAAYMTKYVGFVYKVLNIGYLITD